MKPLLIDNVPENITAHVIRKLNQCRICGGVGHVDLMVHGQYHTRCFIKDKGFKVVLALPGPQKNKFRLKDLTSLQARRLLKQR